MTAIHAEQRAATGAASLSADDRRTALARIEARRAELLAELDQLTAIEAGHWDALRCACREPKPEGHALCPSCDARR